jgi:hypothetical protein
MQSYVAIIVAVTGVIVGIERLVALIAPLVKRKAKP